MRRAVQLLTFFARQLAAFLGASHSSSAASDAKKFLRRKLAMRMRAKCALARMCKYVAAQKV
jgi:hypothetical protein